MARERGQGLVRKVADGHLAERHAGVGVEDVGDVSAELGDVDLAGGLGQGEQACRDPFGVLPDDGLRDGADALAHRAVEAPDVAEIEQADHVPGQDEEIGGVRIGVKEAVDEHLLEDRPRPALGHERTIERRRERRDLRHLHAGHELHRQDAGPRVSPEHAGIRIVGSPPAFWAKRSMVRPSLARSSSRRIDRAN